MISSSHELYSYIMLLVSKVMIMQYMEKLHVKNTMLTTPLPFCEEIKKIFSPLKSSNKKVEWFFPICFIFNKFFMISFRASKYLKTLFSQKTFIETVDLLFDDFNLGQSQNKDDSARSSYLFTFYCS